MNDTCSDLRLAAAVVYQSTIDIPVDCWSRLSAKEHRKHRRVSRADRLVLKSQGKRGWHVDTRYERRTGCDWLFQGKHQLHS